MMLESDAISGKMRIGEVAVRTGLSIDTIRFYERRAVLPKAPRSLGRYRLYRGSDVARLLFVKQMQALGFSLAEIKQLVELREGRQDACNEVRRLLQAKIEAVRSKIDTLTRLERELSLDLDKCDRELKQRKNWRAEGCPVLTADGRSQPVTRETAPGAAFRAAGNKRRKQC